MVLAKDAEMLPNVSGLSLSARSCVPCGTYVTFRTREQQKKDHEDAFVFRETLEDQVDAAECDVCSQPLGEDPEEAVSEGRRLPANSRKWVEFCGKGHYFHRWCIHRHLETRGANATCPDCRRPMSNALRTYLETMEIYPRVPVPVEGAGPSSAPAPAPAAAEQEMEQNEYREFNNPDASAATRATAHIDAMVRRQEDYMLGLGHINDSNEIFASFRVLLARWYDWLPHIRNNLRRLVVVTLNMMLTGMGYRLKDHVLQFLALASTADPGLIIYIHERRDFSSFLPSIRNHLNNAMSRDELNGAGAAAARLLLERFAPRGG